MIPLVDLKAQHDSIRRELYEAIDSVIDDSAFIRGPYVQSFEEEFASFVGGGFCLGASSGTTALELAFRALDIGEGDEIICPSHTFFATAESIMHTGAKPVFADINPDDLLIDPNSVERCMGPKVKAVVPVHLYGQTADCASIKQICDAAPSKPFIIEDAAQAHGATHHGESAGRLGVAAAFSFFPGKNLGALGDAGALVSEDAEFIDRARRLADHGRKTKYEHGSVGFNYRIDGLQAALLSVKLRHLSDWIERRREIADTYRQELAKVPGVTCVAEGSANKSVYHLFVIMVDNRDALGAFLKENGVASGIHYPVPLHKQPALQSHDLRCDDLSVTENACDRILSLPIYPELPLSEVARISDLVANFFEKESGAAA